MAWPHWGIDAPSSLRPLFGDWVCGKEGAPHPSQVCPSPGLGDTLWAWLEDGPPICSSLKGPLLLAWAGWAPGLTVTT